MMKRMPLKVHGRDVHIVHIEADNGSVDAIWAEVCHNIGKGQWCAVRPTEKLDAKRKEQVYNDLINRAYFKGYTGDMLSLKVTEAEGICFRWLKGRPPTTEEVEAVRRKHLDSRNIRQKKYRAKLKRKAVLMEKIKQRARDKLISK